MYLERSVATFLCTLFYIAASCVAIYQEQINRLSQDVSAQLKIFRDSHHAIESHFLRRTINSTGWHAIQGRARTAESLDYILSFNESSFCCVEQALTEQMLYARIMGEDLSECNERAYNKTSDLEEFRQLVGTVQLAAFLALNQGMVAFEVESTGELREQYLREELEFFNEVWGIYKEMLNRRFVDDAVQLDAAFVDVDKCLNQAIYFYNYAIEYVKENLELCLSE